MARSLERVPTLSNDLYVSDSVLMESQAIIDEHLFSNCYREIVRDTDHSSPISDERTVRHQLVWSFVSKMRVVKLVKVNLTLRRRRYDFFNSCFGNVLVIPFVGCIITWIR
jgi:hypothetical protein